MIHLMIACDSMKLQTKLNDCTWWHFLLAEHDEIWQNFILNSCCQRFPGHFSQKRFKGKSKPEARIFDYLFLAGNTKVSWNFLWTNPWKYCCDTCFPIGSRHLSKTISLPLWLSQHHLPVQLEGSALMRTGGPALLPSGTVTWMEKHHSNNKSERVMYTIAIFNYLRVHSFHVTSFHSFTRNPSISGPPPKPP
jgi:hypothetical protein